MTRRTALLGAAAACLSGCQGFTLQDTGANRPTDVLQLTLWAGPEEEAAFRSLIQGFRDDTGVDVQLQIVPFSQALTTVDTALRTGSPPDLFRVTYNDIGLYRSQGVLASVDPGVAAELEAVVAEQFWAAVTDDEGTFGMPHHTDTSMVLVNTAAAEAAGVRSIPTDVDEAWTWEELLDVARRIADEATGGRTALAVNWQQAGAYRWLNWVDQAGGRLLAESLDDVTDDPAAVVAALSVTRSFFRDGLTPSSALPKSSQYTDQLFGAETVAMAFVGSFSLPALDVPFDWVATPLPRQDRASADLGGSALAVVDGPRAEAATAFAAYCMGTQQQADFAGATGVLPTRGDVDVGSLDFPAYPDAMRQFVDQIEVVQPRLVQQVTIPQFNAVNSTLVDQLELAFLAGARSDEDVARDLLRAVAGEVRR
ncbi:MULTISPECIES: extracellular solute-binding protein [unclassified Serinicoccus]|uniref:extracellular solute-binding protein n=1 Tax=unclassified Serinicoccus TaxID=2643101 RepID=UPI0013012BE4|nr:MULTISPECIES: extracellular solute-binding protein [unclassified Serinicoccus]